jgi:hypothetical protein
MVQTASTTWAQRVSFGVSLERNDPPKSPPPAVPSVAAGWVCILMGMAGIAMGWALSLALRGAGILMIFIGGWCTVGFGVAALLHPRLFPREPASQNYWGLGVFAGIVSAAVHAYWLGLFGALF